MVETAQDYPDFTNVVLLSGVDGSGNQVAVLLDAAGQMYTVLRGVDGSGNPQSVKVDSDGQLYTVLQGASGVAVGVDANGFLTTVLKGIRDGTLTTISVDDAGRIEAFIVDSESQWGDVLKVGNADLAARLGSLQTWDWRGSLLYANDFAGGAGNLLKYPSGTGSLIALSPDYWMHGGYSLKMLGGSDGTRTTSFVGEIVHPPSDRVGFQVAYSLIGSPETITIQLKRWAGGKTYFADLRQNRDDYDLEYRNSAGSFIRLRNCFAPGEDEAFSYFKVVCDLNTLKYTRVLYSGYEDDLTVQDLYQSGTGYLDAFYYTVTVVSRSGQNDGIYLDHVLLTVNEPE